MHPICQSFVCAMNPICLLAYPFLLYIHVEHLYLSSPNNAFIFGYIPSLYNWQMSLLGYLTHLDSGIGMDQVQLKGDVGSVVKSPP